jgi:hypothetical protein
MPTLSLQSLPELLNDNSLSNDTIIIPINSVEGVCKQLRNSDLEICCAQHPSIGHLINGSTAYPST